MITPSPRHPLIPPTEGRTPAYLETVRGIVFDIQRMSMHDGPGVRTNVFLKGCPLRCGWCANPESQVRAPQVVLHAANCIECGQFTPPCAACALAGQSQPALHNDLPSPHADVRETAHGRAAGDDTPDLAERIDLCPTGALHWAGEWRTAGEIMAEVRRDRPFYGDGGGLTLTGGEPTMQPDLCAALLRLAKAEGIATAVETCGHTQWPVYARLLPYLDVVLFDVKHADPEVHRRYTGVDNRLILDNLRRLVAAGANVRVRVPLIPGFNGGPESVAAVVRLVQRLPGPVAGVDLLPYHTLGKAKYTALGRAYPWEGHARLSEAEVLACVDAVRGCGLAVTVGG